MARERDTAQGIVRTNEADAEIREKEKLGPRVM